MDFQIIESITDFNKFRSALDPKFSVGCVLTMGALHDGHLALISKCISENTVTIVTIFVNPLQFAPGEDLDAYPRTLDADIDAIRRTMLACEKAREQQPQQRQEDQNKTLDHGQRLVLFVANKDELYPTGFGTTVIPSAGLPQTNQTSEGASRPTFFQGVAIVVLKFFNIIRPHRAYFGQKDAQQCVVIRQIIRDLNLQIELRVQPTFREPDGLAMSSRNAYLSSTEREKSVILYKALMKCQSEFQAGNRDAMALKKSMEQVASSEPLFKLQYVSLSEGLNFTEVNGNIEQGVQVLALIAGFFGKTRLIDNVVLQDFPSLLTT